MRNVLIAASIAAFSASVSAETLIATQDGDTVRITDHPCPQQVHQHLPVPPQFFGAALALVSGQSFAGCWRKVGASIHVIYEDGDQGLIPMAEFKEDVGV